MSIIKKIKQKLGLEEENKTEKIMNERSKLKNEMAQNLANIGFSQEEINEVLDIITKSEEDVQKIKDEMIGTNINNDFAVDVTRSMLSKVRERELQAAQDIKAKIAEIRQRKNK